MLCVCCVCCVCVCVLEGSHVLCVVCRGFGGTVHGREYVTGFRKRKQLRRDKAMEELKEKARLDRLEDRKLVRAGYKILLCHSVILSFCHSVSVLKQPVSPAPVCVCLCVCVSPSSCAATGRHSVLVARPGKDQRTARGGGGGSRRRRVRLRLRLRLWVRVWRRRSGGGGGRHRRV